jgi:branched-chain amino acid transport system permease protein
VALNAVVCVGLNLLIGYAGQISLGHAGFLHWAAMPARSWPSRFGVPVWLSLPAACAAVGRAGLRGRPPTLRLKGHTLAMATLGLGVIISIALTTEDKLTGGPTDVGAAAAAVRRRRAGRAALVLDCRRAAGGTVWLALNLIESPNGRALRALHGSEVAAQTLGIDAARFKLQVFTLSAVLAALAGALTAHYAGFITPVKASFLHSVELVIMVVFGGMASVFGAVVGAAVLTVLPQLLTVLKDYEMMVFGAVLVATMVLFPQGLVPGLARWWRRRTM